MFSALKLINVTESMLAQSFYYGPDVYKEKCNEVSQCHTIIDRFNLTYIHSITSLTMQQSLPEQTCGNNGWLIAAS